MKVIVCGAPCAGKSTYARSLQAPVIHLDTLVAAGLSWSEQSEAALQYLDSPAFVVEGCAAGRTLRKWLERHPGNERPCDRIVRLTAPLTPHSPGQARLAKGEATIWAEIEPELVRRGVALEYGVSLTSQLITS